MYILFGADFSFRFSAKKSFSCSIISWIERWGQRQRLVTIDRWLCGARAEKGDAIILRANVHDFGRRFVCIMCSKPISEWTPVCEPLESLNGHRKNHIIFRSDYSLETRNLTGKCQTAWQRKSINYQLGIRLSPVNEWYIINGGSMPLYSDATGTENIEKNAIPFIGTTVHWIHCQQQPPNNTNNEYVFPILLLLLFINI